MPGRGRSRGPAGTVRHQPRRARCTSCGATHVLLPAVWLLRRADAVVVIGAALEGQAAGKGHRPLAAASGRPVSTVRGWLRRFAATAERARVEFTRLLHALDPVALALTPRGSVVADAVEVIGRAAAAAVVRLAPVGPWEFAARACGRSAARSAGGGSVVSNTS